jgi:exodeoxyribonuclease VII large subunit
MSTLANKIYTVSELTQAIKSHLEPKFFQLTLKGEITNFTMQASGHLYFNLKDENSQISSVLFKNVAMHLSRIPKAGDKVIVKGSISVYVPRGSYQLVVSELQYEGLGDLLLRLHELKEKFQKKGYFDLSHKKPLPKYPKKIGVITSPTGAVIHDILTVLQRRFKGFHLILNPVKVQGHGAEVEIAKAIDDFNKHNLVDVMIVGRGGGSMEDLWAFNEECVVEAIYRSKIPVISSVGHETDFCLADYVADVRAATPSAAAEIVIKEKALQIEFLQNAKKSIIYYLTSSIKQHKLKLRAILKQKIFLSSDYLLNPFFQKTDLMNSEIDRAMEQKLKVSFIQTSHLKKQLSSLEPSSKLFQIREKNTLYFKRLDDRIISSIHQLKIKLTHIKKILDSVNPKEVLKKGYCIPFAENSNSVIISSKDIKTNDSITLQFHDGRIRTNVTKEAHG